MSGTETYYERDVEEQDRDVGHHEVAHPTVIAFFLQDLAASEYSGRLPKVQAGDDDFLREEEAKRYLLRVHEGRTGRVDGVVLDGRERRSVLVSIVAAPETEIDILTSNEQTVCVP